MLTPIKLWLRCPWRFSKWLPRKLNNTFSTSARSGGKTPFAVAPQPVIAEKPRDKKYECRNCCLKSASACKVPRKTTLTNADRYTTSKRSQNWSGEPKMEWGSPKWMNVHSIPKRYHQLANQSTRQYLQRGS